MRSASLFMALAVTATSGIVAVAQTVSVGTPVGSVGVGIGSGVSVGTPAGTVGAGIGPGVTVGTPIGGVSTGPVALPSLPSVTPGAGGGSPGGFPGGSPGGSPGGVPGGSPIGSPSGSATAPGSAGSPGVVGVAPVSAPAVGVTATGGAPTFSGSIAGGGLSGGGFNAATAGSPNTTTAALTSGFGPSSGGTTWDIPSISLPASLAPLGRIDTQTGQRRSLIPRPGTPLQVVQNCRQAIVAAALPYGVQRVDAASAGAMRRSNGGHVAPVEFRVAYARQGGIETRQAVVSCRLNQNGRVFAAL